MYVHSKKKKKKINKGERQGNACIYNEIKLILMSSANETGRTSDSSLRRRKHNFKNINI